MAGVRRGAVLVTGASTGIGEATAVRLARRVSRPGRRPPAEDGDRLRESAAAIEPVTLDVTNAAQLADVSELIRRSEPMGLSGLVNNAGIVVMGPIEGLTTEQWQSQFDVNLPGPVAITTALLPSLLRARGRVINVSSAAGRVALPLFGPMRHRSSRWRRSAMCCAARSGSMGCAWSWWSRASSPRRSSPRRCRPPTRGSRLCPRRPRPATGARSRPPARERSRARTRACHRRRWPQSSSGR